MSGGHGHVDHHSNKGVAMLISVLALVLALLLVVGFVFIREFLDQRIKQPSDLDSIAPFFKPVAIMMPMYLVIFFLQ